MTQSPVATIGGITIVRVDDVNATRAYDRHFYILIGPDGRQVTRSFHYLRNARKHAAWLAR